MRRMSAQRLIRAQPIDEQDAVEVIDLVLEGAGEQARRPRSSRMSPSRSSARDRDGAAGAAPWP